MKNKYLMFAAMAAVMGLSSCDMDKTPYDSLVDTEALQTVTDFKNIRAGIYSGLRSSIGGTFYNSTEIQSGYFNAVSGFTNTYGDMYYWNFNSQSQDFDGIYGSYQAIISRANYIIDGYNKCSFADKEQFTDDVMKNTINPVKGEAYFARAYAIFMLSQYFSPAYSETTANEPNTGVSYSLTYAPSSNQSSYPGRNTLAETYQRVSDDLDDAAKLVAAKGEASSAYVTQDAINALRARMELNRGNYKKAADIAKDLIEGGNYALAADKADLEDIFYNDGGMETILQMVSASASELPSSTGYHFQIAEKGKVPDYVPTQALLDLYSDKDYRLPVYFNKINVSTADGASASVYALNKYPDQGGLYKKYGSSARFTSEPKVFRIAEMYLIAAEGYAMSDDLETASIYLNQLQENRIKGFTDVTYTSKDDIMAEIKNERAREFVGEGMHLFDLKRWHEGVKRGTPQNLSICLLPGANTTELDKPADSYLMTWPIPRHELDTNPQIKQNPGYNK